MKLKKRVHQLALTMVCLLVANGASAQSIFAPDRTSIEHQVEVTTGEVHLRYSLDDSKENQIAWNSRWTIDQGLGNGWCFANQVEYLKTGWFRLNRCGEKSFDLVPDKKTLDRLRVHRVTSGEQLKTLNSKKRLGEEFKFLGYTRFLNDDDLRTLTWTDKAIQVVGGNETVIRTIYNAEGRQTTLERWDRKSQKLIYEANYEYKPNVIIKTDPDIRMALYLSGDKKISDIEISSRKNQFSTTTASLMKYGNDGNLDAIERRTTQPNKLPSESNFDLYTFRYGSDQLIQLAQVDQKNSRKILKLKFDQDNRAESLTYAYKNEKGDTTGSSKDYQYVTADGEIIKFTTTSTGTELTLKTTQIITINWGEIDGSKGVARMIFD